MGELTGIVFHLIPEIQRKMVGWDCARRIKVENCCFEPMLYDILQPGETFTTGRDVAICARNKGLRAGICHAEAMHRESWRFPFKWREHEYLLFSEIWRRPDGRYKIPVLRWRYGFWKLDFVPFGLPIYRGRVVGSIIRSDVLPQEDWVPGSGLLQSSRL